MKSEHRHELKTNELERIASDLGHASERYVQTHTNQLIAVAVVLVAIVIGAIYWRMSSGSFDRQGWRALSDAGSTADYGTVADKYAGTKVAPWARLREGEAELTSGIRLLFTDRDAGRSDLKKAEENFEKLIAEKLTPPEVVERALFGLGRCQESLPAKNAGTATINDPAIETYERLLKEFPDSVYKPLVESRIAVLRTGSAQDFNAWFETQNPKPADRTMPKDLSIPPLPEDFGPTGKTSGKDGSAAPAKDGKKTETAPAQKSAGAVPVKPSGKPIQSGPALPNSSAPASK
ncbi:MAG TPA: hypothetical protein VMR25_11300 [Planctomycetaceae bacterium]|jgi:nitrogen fixation-related uncharacterized protein|nr:hypothetical protein [Planctomycetaceae bacterium]